MSTPESMNDLFTDELADLWSANDQMVRMLKKVTGKVSDTELKSMLTESLDGIATHTDMIKSMIERQGEKLKKEHCKGMEGLVAEATKHIVDEGPAEGPLLDAVIVTQYMRMSHYGIAGFGSATAYAKALGLSAEAKQLADTVKDIYAAEKYFGKLGTSANQEAITEE